MEASRRATRTGRPPPGPFPATHVDDPDLQRALDEPQALLEARARELAILAVDDGQPWAAQLGRLSIQPLQRERGLRRLDTNAAYRERWRITGRSILGNREPASPEREGQRQLAQRAVTMALTIHRTGRTVGAPRQPAERHASREGIELWSPSAGPSESRRNSSPVNVWLPYTTHEPSPSGWRAVNLARH